MDANSLVLGGPEGLVGMADRLGRTEFDRREKHRADLMKLMEELARAKEEERRKAEMHPLELEGKRRSNIEADIRARQGEHELGLDKIYGPQQREANLAQTRSSTQVNQYNLTKKAGDDFLDFVGRQANSGKVLMPEDIDAAARQFQLPPNHPLVEALKALPPDQQKKSIIGMQTGGTTNQETRTREAAALDKATTIEDMRTARAIQMQLLKNQQQFQMLSQRLAARKENLTQQVARLLDEGNQVMRNTTMPEEAKNALLEQINNQLMQAYNAEVGLQQARGVGGAQAQAAALNAATGGRMPGAAPANPQPPRVGGPQHSATPLTNTGGATPTAADIQYLQQNRNNPEIVAKFRRRFGQLPPGF